MIGRTHPIAREIDDVRMAIGAGLLALGCAAVGVALSVVGPIAVFLSIVGSIASLLGLYLAATSVRQEKCAACNVSLGTMTAAFPLESSDVVLHAARSLDVARLSTIPMSPMNGDNVKVTLQVCPTCRYVAKLSVGSFADRARVLEPGLVVLGPAVQAMARFMDDRDTTQAPEFDAA